MFEISPEVEDFLHAIINKVNSGERDENFAEWAAVMAAFMLSLRNPTK